MTLAVVVEVAIVELLLTEGDTDDAWWLVLDGIDVVINDVELFRIEEVKVVIGVEEGVNDGEIIGVGDGDIVGDGNADEDVNADGDIIEDIREVAPVGSGIELAVDTERNEELLEEEEELLEMDDE